MSFLEIQNYQLEANPKPRVGIKAGFNITKLNTSPLLTDIYWSNGIGLSHQFIAAGGLAIELDYGRWFILEVDLLHDPVGIRNGKSGTRLRLNYISLPIILKLPIVKRRFQWHLGVGTKLSLLISAKSKPSFGSNPSTNVSANHNKVDLGLTSLMYLGYKLKKITFGVDFRYSVGFLNTTRTIPSTEKLTSESFSMFFGISSDI